MDDFCVSLKRRAHDVQKKVKVGNKRIPSTVGTRSVQERNTKETHLKESLSREIYRFQA